MEGFSKFKNGHWTWNENSHGVQFISHDVNVRQVVTTSKVKKPGKQIILPSSIRFKETIDTTDKIYFRRMLQRHVKLNDPDFISVQDIKDVALFLANPKDLTPELISYYHLPEIDNFLKNIIIYVQYYLQIWDQMLIRRVEAKRKIRQPIVAELEDVVRDDLSDVRSMLAREYSIVLLGIGKSKPYHHLTNSTISLAERDKRLFEAFLCMAIRIVWLALQRKHFPVIELELNRLFRTDFFNVITHRSNRMVKAVWRSAEEDRVLVGTSLIKESKLKQKSPLLKELLAGKHDCRMLGAGFRDFYPKSERAIYMDRLFAAPCEKLFEYGITIGLVGIPRDEYDAMLYPRQRTSKNFDQALIEPIHFQFPVYEDIPDKDIPREFPKERSMYEESLKTKHDRRFQCHMWKNYLMNQEKNSANLSFRYN